MPCIQFSSSDELLCILPYLMLVTTMPIGRGKCLSGLSYLSHNPIFKSAECNTYDVYHRDTFINILRCSLLYFLNRATCDLSKRNLSKVQPMAKTTVLPKTGGSLLFAISVTTGTWLSCEKSRKEYDVITLQMLITKNYDK